MLTCSCCGKGVMEEENVAKDEEPYPYDTGYGMCIECGGDKDADISTEEGVKKKLGWAAQCFYEARFDVISKALGDEAKAKFESMTYLGKVNVVTRFLEKGILKW